MQGVDDFHGVKVVVGAVDAGCAGLLDALLLLAGEKELLLLLAVLVALALHLLLVLALVVLFFLARLVAVDDVADDARAVVGDGSLAVDDEVVLGPPVVVAPEERDGRREDNLAEDVVDGGVDAEEDGELADGRDGGEEEGGKAERLDGEGGGPEEARDVDGAQDARLGAEAGETEARDKGVEERVAGERDADDDGEHEEEREHADARRVDEGGDACGGGHGERGHGKEGDGCCWCARKEGGEDEGERETDERGPAEVGETGAVVVVLVAGEAEDGVAVAVLAAGARGVTRERRDDGCGGVAGVLVWQEDRDGVCAVGVDEVAGERAVGDAELRLALRGRRLHELAGEVPRKVALAEVREGDDVARGDERVHAEHALQEHRVAPEAGGVLEDVALVGGGVKEHKGRDNAGREAEGLHLAELAHGRRAAGHPLAAVAEEADVRGLHNEDGHDGDGRHGHERRVPVLARHPREEEHEERGADARDLGLVLVWQRLGATARAHARQQPVEREHRAAERHERRHKREHRQRRQHRGRRDHDKVPEQRAAEEEHGARAQRNKACGGKRNSQRRHLHCPRDGARRVAAVHAVAAEKVQQHKQVHAGERDFEQQRDNRGRRLQRGCVPRHNCHQRHQHGGVQQHAQSAQHHRRQRPSGKRHSQHHCSRCHCHCNHHFLLFTSSKLNRSLCVCVSCVCCSPSG